MKRFNKNSVVFFVVVVFIITGFFGGFTERLIDITKSAWNGLSQGDIGYLLDYRDNLEDISSKQLMYHDMLMDTNSIRENIIGTKVFKKGETTVVKTDNEKLVVPISRLSDDNITKAVNRIEELKKVSESFGAGFLYCFAPPKEVYCVVPEIFQDYSLINNKLFLQKMSEYDIPYVDLGVSLIANGLSKEEMFYSTDHHWTVNSGFCAAKIICEELHNRYGFPVNADYNDENNYDTRTYKNWFLGSYGKKVGAYFSWKGADDFELITPKFHTDMTEEQPFKESVRTGEFKDSVLYLENMVKDYYKINTYATYSGGDFHLQIMKNNLNPEGKKILLIRDSFACVVAPFLALQTSELHICDMRVNEHYVGEKINVKEYINEIQPDYVIVLYSGVSSVEHSSGKYDFF